MGSIEDAEYVESSALTGLWVQKRSPANAVCSCSHQFGSLCDHRAGHAVVDALFWLFQTLSFASFLHCSTLPSHGVFLIRETHVFSGTTGQLGYIIGMLLV